MGKRAPCEKHGIQWFITTSPKLATAIDNSESVSIEEIRIVQIDSDGMIFKNTVDAGFLEELSLPFTHAVVCLKDRDKSAKQLYDRILILKMRKEMKWVCPACLRDSLHHP
ncbi:hypothetical protein INH39_01330 [Massilia violaceinigra]|uniref:Uncharacterized protein n=1 Tax=Massilia violaceinigra TaxID=2045208 RepID=A0ABY4A8W2_9BURK|nr:hypothetical protein [Massilia violaceinigra]UOD30429.1 hypothetical protein INH39_01330 [Massilia violaceinigra]